MIQSLDFKIQIFRFKVYRYINLVRYQRDKKQKQKKHTKNRRLWKTYNPLDIDIV